MLEADVQTDRSSDRTVRGALIGGAGGLALGAILGKSAGGAILGGVLGAGAGTAIALGTGEVDAVLPADTVMRIETTRRVELAVPGDRT